MLVENWMTERVSCPRHTNTFPLRNNYSAVSQSDVPLNHNEQTAQVKGARSLRVLIADDDRDTVLTLAMVLRDEGHEVRGVYSGVDVLSAVRQFVPHAVVVDINMPDLDGYDVARAIRTRNANVLLIAISGVYKGDPDKLLAGLVGFDHFLPKPYQTSDVLNLLEPLRTRSEP
jgi:DNA-binding response OmpR family regulator